MNRRIILFLFLIVPLAALGQKKYQPLKVGDTVPDFALEMLNGQMQQRTLSGYRGKLLILDCWNIYCGSCIRAMPELVKVQQRFKDQLNIVALEGGTRKEKVLSFLADRKLKGRAIELPVAHIPGLNDSTLYQLFPILHYGFPVELWIDPKGVFIGSTGSAAVNYQMISMVLSGNTRALGQRHFQQDFKNDEPILIKNNGGPDGAFSFRAVITPYIDSIPRIGTDFYTNRNSRSTRIFFANRTISDLVKIAVYRDLKDVFNKFLLLKVKDPGRYVVRKSEPDEMKTNAYCYELILPPDRTIEEAFDFMLDDLKRYFRIHAALQLQPVKCLVLERLGNDALRSAGSTLFYKDDHEERTSLIELKSQEFSRVISFLDKRNYPVVIDRTGINYPVNVKLELPDEYHYESLQQVLRSVGLKATEQMIEQPVLVISDM